MSLGEWVSLLLLLTMHWLLLVLGTLLSWDPFLEDFLLDRLKGEGETVFPLHVEVDDRMLTFNREAIEARVGAERDRPCWAEWDRPWWW